jgi:hypothetical protein
MTQMSLYRRVLGDRFNELPEILKRFHGCAEGGTVKGSFRVVRCGGRFRRVVAEILQMPRTGESVPICLEVIVEGDRERWVRQFADRCTATIQWADGNLLMERFGPVSFSSELAVLGSRLQYEFRRAWFAGVLLPRWFSPYVESYVDAGEAGWHVVVHIFAPWLGEIVHYEGWIEPQ